MRAIFGGTSADFVVTVGPVGQLHSVPATLTFWTAQTGGTRVTDLLLNGQPVDKISAPRGGAIPAFEGPDGVVQLWADAGGAGRSLLAAQGRQGPQGLPGVNAVPAKAAVDAYMGELLDDPTSTVSVKQSASIAAALAGSADEFVLDGGAP